MDKNFRNLFLKQNPENINLTDSKANSLLSNNFNKKSKIKNISSLQKSPLLNLNSTNIPSNNISNDTYNSPKNINNIKFYSPSVLALKKKNNLISKNNLTNYNNDSELPIIPNIKNDTTYLSTTNYSNTKKASFISPEIKPSSMSISSNNVNNISPNRNSRVNKRELSVKYDNMRIKNNSFSISKNNKKSKWAECQKKNYILLGKFIKVEEKVKHKKKIKNKNKIKNYEKLTISRSIHIKTSLKYNIHFTNYINSYLGKSNNIENIQKIKIFGEELNEIKDELNDIVDDKSFDLIKMTKPLKIFFNSLCCNNKNTLKDKKKIKDFFKKFENRVNFLYDIYKIPYIKNKLSKVYKNFSVDNLYPEELNNLHFINNKVWKFNNMNKVLINAKNDMKKYANKEDLIKNNIESISNNIEDGKNNKDWVYSYNAENYFIHKKNLQRETGILPDEQKKFFYENFFLSN